MAFKKGQSGNPKGRPKKGETLTGLLREMLETPKTAKSKRTQKEVLVQKLIDMAAAGDVAALRYCFDRLDGKPRETVTASVTGNVMDIEAIKKKLEDALLNEYARV